MGGPMVSLVESVFERRSSVPADRSQIERIVNRDKWGATADFYYRRKLLCSATSVRGVPAFYTRRVLDTAQVTALAVALQMALEFVREKEAKEPR